jgi:hypothetical protein
MKKNTSYYELLLRRLRAHPCLDGDGSKADQVGRLIEIIKRRCAPAWDERARRLQEAHLDRWFAIQ